MISLSYTYAQLPEDFYQEVSLPEFPKPSLLKWNHKLAEDLGLEVGNATEAGWLNLFMGKTKIDGSKLIAQAYSGHQFGHFNPNLGDGRALLLGELSTSEGLKDLHLKGSGATRYSRRGDGRAQITSVLKEFIIGESLKALGIPTSRTLAIIRTGEIVERETSQDGAIQVRVASSHIRVGTFEHFAARGQIENLKHLARYTILRHYPELDYNLSGLAEFFEKTVKRQAELVAQWMSVGFIHGVMNTDNMAISGESIDFGPCAFMGAYSSNRVFSRIDQDGRYAYGAQPSIAKWNLTSLAFALSLLWEENHQVGLGILQERLSSFDQIYNAKWLELFNRKLGIAGLEVGNHELISQFLEILESNKNDFSIAFRNLENYIVETGNEVSINKNRTQGLNLPLEWVESWVALLKKSKLSAKDIKNMIQKSNPIFVPRNHLIEKALSEVAMHGNWNYFDQLLSAVSDPYLNLDYPTEFRGSASSEEESIPTHCNT